MDENFAEEFKRVPVYALKFLLRELGRPVHGNRRNLQAKLGRAREERPQVAVSPISMSGKIGAVFAAPFSLAPFSSRPANHRDAKENNDTAITAATMNVSNKQKQCM